MTIQNLTQDEQSVIDFFSYWGPKDVKRIMTFFASDAAYIDVPLPRRETGIEAVESHIYQTLEALSLRVETLHIASRRNVILTERVDYISVSGSEDAEVELPVMGVMEMKDGKIAVWRDYFDLATLEEGLGISLKPSDES